MEQIKYDDEQQYQQAFNFGLNHQIVSSSSSSSASCHIFFNPTQDHAGFYHPQYSYQRHHRYPHDDYYAYGGSSSYEIERKAGNGVKLSMWKKEDEDGVTKECVSAKIEVKTSCFEEELSSNSSSYKCSNTTPIRVCSDCHTTKTPLWRSGPKGPKSLCNACGIRQRKARRAVAAAANGGGGTSTSNPPRATKEKEKEKMGKFGLKKRYKMDGSSSSGRKKMNGFEDFLINLSNKLAIHRVFPQDEKEAAILLMALSSGLVHG